MRDEKAGSEEDVLYVATVERDALSSMSVMLLQSSVQVCGLAALDLPLGPYYLLLAPIMFSKKIDF